MLSLQLSNLPIFRKPFLLVKLFCAFWLLLFAIYFPAAKAGFVADFTGWLDQTQRYGFWDNINRTHYIGHSLYQFTQFNTWVFYQFFGIHAWLWHLLHLTIHAANVTLLYKLTSGLMVDAGVKKPDTIALAGALLFCVSPYLSEVVIWEPSYHFLQGLFLILLILNWGRAFINTSQKKYALFAGITYLLSSFSLEIFYITPWLVLFMAIFYQLISNKHRSALSSSFRYIFIPHFAIFIFHLVLFHFVYGSWVAHIGTGPVAHAYTDGIGKPAKHLFHTLLLGRFLPTASRQYVYTFCDSYKGLIVFYSLVVAVGSYILFRFRQMSNKGKVASLLLVWIAITLAILVPLWFEELFVVLYDRYTYFTSGFLYMLLALIVSFIPVVAIRLTVVGLYMLLNLRFAIQVSRYWMKSARVIESLLATFPYSTHKTVVILNVPQNMQGVAMIGAEQESEVKLMNNLLLPQRATKAPVYDAMAYNMLTPDDGANVTVINDSTIKVTLNQWGTWWWYAMQGGKSYSNEDYSLNLKDPGRFYELTLKKPAENYLLLYQIANQWKIVDMANKNVQQ